MVKSPPANSGDPGLIPGPGRSSGEGKGNTLQYCYLENPMDRGAWQATVHGVTKSWTLLSDWKMTSPVFTTFSRCSLHVVWTLHISAHAALHLIWEVPFRPFFLFKYLFVWLYQVLLAACRIFSGNMQTLNCGIWDLLVVPWPGIKPGPLALTAWSLSHWDHQGSPSIHFYSKSLLQAKLKHQVSRLLGGFFFFFCWNNFVSVWNWLAIPSALYYHLSVFSL